MMNSNFGGFNNQIGYGGGYGGYGGGGMGNAPQNNPMEAGAFRNVYGVIGIINNINSKTKLI